MEIGRRWFARMGAVVTAAVVAVLFPVAAWAGSRPGLVAAGTELARRRPRGRGALGGLGLVGGCCCLVVVGVAVLVVYLIGRRRRQRPPAPPQ
jgi:hypothetical protein